MKDKQTSPELITRREAVLRVSAMFGGAALVGQAAILSAVSEAAQEPAVQSNALFSDRDVAFLDEIAETILPETDTPGAKAAEVGAFMALMVADTYYDNDQEIFKAGMTTIDDRSREANGGDFMSADAEQRLSILEEFDAEQFDYMENKAADAPAHFFRMMKELALLGYFTSEIGYTQAMRYTETPGRYDPCTPFTQGEKAWAEHA